MAEGARGGRRNWRRKKGRRIAQVGSDGEERLGVARAVAAGETRGAWSKRKGIQGSRKGWEHGARPEVKNKWKKTH